VNERALPLDDTFARLRPLAPDDLPNRADATDGEHNAMASAIEAQTEVRVGMT
jgi:hypothetical protein